MGSNFKLKMKTSVFLIIVINSLPTKQDTGIIAEESANKPLQEADRPDENQPLQADEKIGETIEEQDKSQPLQASENVETLEVNDNQELDASEAIDESQALANSDEKETLYNSNSKGENTIGADCWLKLNATNHFKLMDELDTKFSKDRHYFNDKVAETLNGKMLRALLDSRGIAFRALHNTAGDPSQIPAGLHLGGYSMVRMQDSILFFHRMKLRNNTVFRVEFFENNLVDMSVVTRLCLNDLHLVGAYERSATHKNPSILFYAPSYGEIEILMKNVNYNMEGRLRLQNKRLVIEVVESELIFKDDILMTYLDSNETDIKRVQKKNLEDFIARMKNDLDMWLKDYFNDYYTYFQFNVENERFKNYEKRRLVTYNDYADYAIMAIRRRIYDLGLFLVKLPKFTLFSVPNVQVKLYDGYIRGLDTIFRRSFTTGKKAKDIRYVDMMVGFSNLKVEYGFTAMLPNGQPQLVGRLMLTADDLAAHLQIAMVKDPEAVTLKFDFIQHLKPESLVVEGPANRFTTNFKHLLENHAIAIMSNALIFHINMLSTITRCFPKMTVDGRPNAYFYKCTNKDHYVNKSYSNVNEMGNEKLCFIHEIFHFANAIIGGLFNVQININFVPKMTLDGRPNPYFYNCTNEDHYFNKSVSNLNEMGNEQLCIFNNVFHIGNSIIGGLFNVQINNG